MAWKQKLPLRETKEVPQKRSRAPSLQQPRLRPPRFLHQQRVLLLPARCWRRRRRSGQDGSEGTNNESSHDHGRSGLVKITMIMMVVILGLVMTMWMLLVTPCGSRSPLSRLRQRQKLSSRAPERHWGDTALLKEWHWVFSKALRILVFIHYIKGNRNIAQNES